LPVPVSGFHLVERTVPDPPSLRQYLQLRWIDWGQRAAAMAGGRTIFAARTGPRSFPIVVGLAAAAANYGVARLLAKPSENSAAIRLAYIHNLGDVWVSFAPVAAGLALLLTGYSFIDPLIAGAIALWIIVSTAQEVLGSHDELIWPDKIVCNHADQDEPAVRTT
jgi:divalent metal cation (Fe/Co/Zn/Cd) transporter